MYVVISNIVKSQWKVYRDSSLFYFKTYTVLTTPHIFDLHLLYTSHNQWSCKCYNITRSQPKTGSGSKSSESVPEMQACCVSLFRNSSFFNTVDGRNPANQLIDGLYHYLQGFIHPRWCKISSINTSSIVFIVFVICCHNLFLVEWKVEWTWCLTILHQVVFDSF